MEILYKRYKYYIIYKLYIFKNCRTLFVRRRIIRKQRPREPEHNTKTICSISKGTTSDHGYPVTLWLAMIFNLYCTRNSRSAKIKIYLLSIIIIVSHVLRSKEYAFWDRNNKDFKKFCSLVLFISEKTSEIKVLKF